MKKRNACVLASIVILACSSRTYAAAPEATAPLSPAEIAAKAALTPPFSEEKNAASAFIGAHNFYIGRMALACEVYLNQPYTFPKDMVAKWQIVNGKYVQAGSFYLRQLFQSISDPDASALLLSHVKSEVQRNGQGSVDDQVKGTVEEKTAACKKFVANLNGGKYDVAKGSPFYATLVNMVDEFRQ